ncbi:MAG TPA: hypothetical protein VM889_11960, partial [Candidatus Thermoplasmatota archaeon]|nr:hypothetical protein [Candidatus Thermoplasmatota archaeon]
SPEEEALYQARQALPREVVDALDAVHRLERRYHTISPEQAKSAILLLLGEEHQDKAPVFLKAK